MLPNPFQIRSFLCTVATIAMSWSGLAQRPNVLFIAVDDLSNAIGAYGDPIAQTPHIDRLASTGVLFERAYNQIPLCNPSRASVMTGLRPDDLEVYDLTRHFREAQPKVETLSQAFMRSGYSAQRVGKIYHFNVPDGIGTEGFDDPSSWQQTFNPKGRDKDDEALIFNAEPHRKISGALSWLAADGADTEQTDGMITSKAIELLSEPREDPFFIAVGFFRPHTPYVAPKAYFDLYPLESIRLPWAPEDDRDDVPVAAFAHNNPVPHYGLDSLTVRKALQAYYACVSFVDAQVGRLLEALKQQGLEDNTIVVFWSDHGYHLGEHNGIWQKRTLFEQGSRAPLIIRAPGLEGNGRPCRRIVEFVDIYPTLLELADIKANNRSPSLAGRSLVPLLENPLTSWNGEAVTQILRPADTRLPTPVMGRSIRTDRWRYSEWNGGAAGIELYDHYADPMEFNNLAGALTPYLDQVVQDLRQKLDTKARANVPPSPFNPAKL